MVELTDLRSSPIQFQKSQFSRCHAELSAGFVFAGLVLAGTALGFDQFHFRGVIQITGVAFICIEVDFQPDVLVVANQQVFKSRRATLGMNPQVHVLAVFDSVVGQIFRSHVDVSLSADDS